MVRLEKLETSLLNHLTTEIIVLDKDLNILWINESGLANGWIKDSKEPSSYSNFLSYETESELKRIMNMAVSDKKSVTKRDFELIANDESVREVDLTVSFSTKDKQIIVEVMCVDNLNRIID